MDSEIKKHLTNSEANINDDGHKIPRSSSTSSESSIDSRYVDKDPLIELHQGNIESKESPETFSHNPSMSINDSSPQNHMMPQAAAAGGYDPNRIPSAIFASKPTTPMEWSVASNESLFSIHMGNNSFSKDNVFLTYKSGELPRLEDTNNPPPPPSQVLPVVGNVVKKTEHASKDAKVTQAQSAEPAKIESQFSGPNAPKAKVQEETENNGRREKIPSHNNAEDVRNSSSSTQSFQFPVLEANVGGSASVKVVMEKQASNKKRQQQQQEAKPQAPGTPSKPTGGSSWFSCFSCCSLGCS